MHVDKRQERRLGGMEDGPTNATTVGIGRIKDRDLVTKHDHGISVLWTGSWRDTYPSHTGSLQIDLVCANTEASNGNQLFRFIQDFLCHLCLASDAKDMDIAYFFP